MYFLHLAVSLATNTFETPIKPERLGRLPSSNSWKCASRTLVGNTDSDMRAIRFQRIFKNLWIAQTTLNEQTCQVRVKGLSSWIDGTNLETTCTLSSNLRSWHEFN